MLRFILALTAIAIVGASLASRLSEVRAAAQKTEIKSKTQGTSNAPYMKRTPYMKRAPSSTYMK
jgi:hypothetical protein